MKWRPLGDSNPCYRRERAVSKGEEIWTDQYGRVKVHFHWDRHDQSNENSSCWMRVSQAWAGKNWGSILIPRIGQEVIVSFLEGDPDRSRPSTPSPTTPTGPSATCTPAPSAGWR